jgi:hypothetical protein
MAQAKRCPVRVGLGSHAKGSRVNARSEETDAVSNSFWRFTGPIERILDRPTANRAQRIGNVR